MSDKETLIQLIRECRDEILLSKIANLLQHSQPNVVNEADILIVNNEPLQIFRDSRTDHKIMQIDLNVVSQNEELLEDIYDLIEIERTKNDALIPWETVKQNLGLNDL